MTTHALVFSCPSFFSTSPVPRPIPYSSPPSTQTLSSLHSNPPLIMGQALFRSCLRPEAPIDEVVAVDVMVATSSFWPCMRDAVSLAYLP